MSKNSQPNLTSSAEAMQAAERATASSLLYLLKDKTAARHRIGVLLATPEEPSTSITVATYENSLIQRPTLGTIAIDRIILEDIIDLTTDPNAEVFSGGLKKVQIKELINYYITKDDEALIVEKFGCMYDQDGSVITYTVNAQINECTALSGLAKATDMSEPALLLGSRGLSVVSEFEAQELFAQLAPLEPAA